MFYVESREGKGRCALASMSLTAGTLVCRASPQAFQLSNSKTPYRCDYCLCLSSRPMKCSGCKSALYCSVKCQKSDWGAHKVVCKCFGRCDRPPLPSLKMLSSAAITNPNIFDEILSKCSSPVVCAASHDVCAASHGVCAASHGVCAASHDVCAASHGVCTASHGVCGESGVYPPSPHVFSKSAGESC
eukprot:GHVR01118937.1.p1 GENE.GHVR01118937.1~~GHVR01118937.1.p1  ORF type:complete len:188 (+),score=66.45 GHVR01118937.1:221-784(+)